MSKNEGKVMSLPGVKHQGTKAFGNRVLRNRKRNKLAKKSRRKNR